MKNDPSLSNSSDQNPSLSSTSDNLTSDLATSRRQFLGKCGKFTVYAAPATMLLMTAPKAIAQSASGSGE